MNFIFKSIIIFLIIFMPHFLWGGAPPPSPAPENIYFDHSYTITGTDNTALEKTIIASFMLTYFIGLLLGIFMFFAAIKRLIEHSKSPNDPRYSVGGVIVLMLGASLLFGLQDTVGIATNTLTGKGFCFNYHDQVTVTDGLDRAKTDCFNFENSELTKDLHKRLVDNGDTIQADELAKKLKLFFTAMQAIGLIYFIKGIYLLKTISENSGRTDITYGKVLVMLIFSSLVIDMPNTLEILVEFAKQVAIT